MKKRNTKRILNYKYGHGVPVVSLDTFKRQLLIAEQETSIVYNVNSLSDNTDIKDLNLK